MVSWLPRMEGVEQREQTAHRPSAAFSIESILRSGLVAPPAPAAGAGAASEVKREAEGSEQAQCQEDSEDEDGLGEDRKKRPRTAFTAAQIKALEGEFERNKYLSVSKRMQLSKQLRLTETQVRAVVNTRATSR